MKRSTWITVIVFLALAGFTFYLSRREPIADTVEITPRTPAEFLFTSSDGFPISIEIVSAADSQVAIARNETGEWVLKQPIKTEASQGAAEAAAAQLTSLRIVSHPELAPVEAGLVSASYTLTVELSSGAKKVVRIGDLTPTGIGYYANVDKSDEVLIISKDGLDALLILLESPPFESTSTP